MALALRTALFETSSCLKEFRRFRGKVNVRRPRQPHFVRATYLALTKPWFINPNKDKTPAELCKGFIVHHKQAEDNPFQRIIARELYRWISTSRLVVFYHQNPMKAEAEFKAYSMFKKQNMHFKKYGKKTLEMAVEGTPYETVLDFYVSQNMTVFSPEPEIKKMLMITKKFPQLVLLAAILEGKFISKDELIKYSEIPDIQTAQAGLVQTLRGVANQLVSHLNCHQTGLVSNLNERIKQLQEQD